MKEIKIEIKNQKKENQTKNVMIYEFQKHSIKKIERNK